MKKITLILFFTGCFSTLLLAQNPLIKVAYVGLKGGVDMGYLGPDGGLDFKAFGLGRGHNAALEAVNLAFKEAQQFGRYKKIDFALIEKIGSKEKDVLKHVEDLQKEQIPYWLLDVPASLVKTITEKTKNQKVLLFNLASPEDKLRAKFCASHLFHIMPSRAMLADGLGQYLVKRKWMKWLLITGPRARDQAFAEAMIRTSKRYGATIVDKRLWKDNADLRRSASAEFPLFTAQVEYDVVVVADEESEFGEYIPFNTYIPRPVVGTHGLSPHPWFWGFSQWAAVQLSKRFYKKTKRKMTDTDWTGWMGMTVIATAIIKGGSTKFEEVKNYLLNPEISFHGYKGRSLSFRSWNHQLRQPILLTTPLARVSTSPQEGYLHPTNKLDTLGYDQPENQCKM